MRRSIFSFLCMAALMTGCGTREDAPGNAAVPPEVGRIMGRWLRPDGNYVLELRSAASGGALDAGYYNPNPIHVSRATWQRGSGGEISVYVELRDTGYPGATYELQYRAAEDQLAGTYTQPAFKQTFDVFFVRQP